MERNQSRPKITNLVGRHFDGDEQRLFIAAGQMRDLRHSPGWLVLVELIGELRAGSVDRLADVLPSRSDYAYEGGQVKGLDAAREVVQAVIDHADRVREQLEREVQEREAAGV